MLQLAGGQFINLTLNKHNGHTLTAISMGERHFPAKCVLPAAGSSDMDYIHTAFNTRRPLAHLGLSLFREFKTYQ